MTMIQHLRLFLTVLLNVVLVSSAICQTAGKITGKVQDAASGDPLPGANVLLLGTSMGASTDLNGNYQIRNIPAGSYSVRVTYIGYDPLNITVQMEGGLDLAQNFKLQAVALKGQEVVVTAQASGQNAAINQQLSSMQITNVVSAARIQELPDANAAESVARLPGVSVLRTGGEADQVVIRGLAPKYNQITINGVQMAGSDPNDRSVDLSMISSSSLNGEEVTKTITPDVDANVLGGVVNFDLREASTDNQGIPKFGLTLQGGYNGLSDVYNRLNNYVYVGSADDRFLDGRLGVFAQASYERRNLSDNELGAAYGKGGTDPNPYLDTDIFMTQSVTIDDVTRDRRRGNGVLTVDYDLPEGKIILSNFVSSGVTVTDNRQQFYNVEVGPVQDFNAIRTNSTLNTVTNLLTVEHQAGLFHVKATLSHAYSETRDPGDWQVNFINGTDGTPSSLLLGTNVDPKDIVKSANNALGGDTTRLYTVQTQYTFTRERNYTAALDLDTHVRFSDDITSVFKVGGKFQYQARSYNTDYIDGESFTYASGAGIVDSLKSSFPSLQTTSDGNSIRMAGPVLDPNYNYGTFLGGDYQMVHSLNFNFLQSMVNYLNGHLKQIGQNINYNYDIGNSEQSDYSGQEEISAAYAMATVNLGPTLSVIPGVRWQQLRTDYVALQGARGPNPYSQYTSRPDTVIAYHPYWLPDALLRYRPFDWLDVRLAYTNTVSYPDYAALAPIIVVNQTANTIQWNGFNLNPQRSTNYDVELSLYNNTIGLFTAGGFLKQITDLIYQYQFKPNTVAMLAQYYPAWLPRPTAIGPTVSEYVNNPYRVNDYGMELEWQTHFWYLPGPLTGLVLNVNFTHIFSKASYPASYTTNIRTGAFVDTSYYAPLLYQPDDILNLTIGYDFMGFSIRVSSIYSSKIFTQPELEPVLRAYTSAYSRWDIAAKQDLPFPGLQMYCSLDNVNGANDVSEISSPIAVPQSEQSYGYRAELGLRYKF